MSLMIDGSKIKDANTFHKYIADELNFPSYYGENLDALWDILSVWDKDLEIQLIDETKFLNNLGLYAEKIIKLLIQLTEENKNIIFIRNNS